MFVVKRNGQQDRVSFDKITSRINKLCYGLDRDFIDPVIISQKVVQVRSRRQIGLQRILFFFFRSSCGLSFFRSSLSSLFVGPHPLPPPPARPPSARLAFVVAALLSNTD